MCSGCKCYGELSLLRRHRQHAKSSRPVSSPKHHQHAKASLHMVPMPVISTVDFGNGRQSHRANRPSPRTATLAKAYPCNTYYSQEMSLQYSWQRSSENPFATAGCWFRNIIDGSAPCKQMQVPLYHLGPTAKSNIVNILQKWWHWHIKLSSKSTWKRLLPITMIGGIGKQPPCHYKCAVDTLPVL